MFRLVPGGMMILHDYDSGCWLGVIQTADEFLADKPEGLIRIPDKSAQPPGSGCGSKRPECDKERKPTHRSKQAAYDMAS